MTRFWADRGADGIRGKGADYPARCTWQSFVYTKLHDPQPLSFMAQLTRNSIITKSTNTSDGNISQGTRKVVDSHTLLRNAQNICVAIKKRNIQECSKFKIFPDIYSVKSETVGCLRRNVESKTRAGTKQRGLLYSNGRSGLVCSVYNSSGGCLL